MEAGISILKIKLDGSKNPDRLKNQENSKIKVKLGFTELAHFFNYWSQARHLFNTNPDMGSHLLMRPCIYLFIFTNSEITEK